MPDVIFGSFHTNDMNFISITRSKVLAIVGEHSWSFIRVWMQCQTNSPTTRKTSCRALLQFGSTVTEQKNNCDSNSPWNAISPKYEFCLH